MSDVEIGIHRTGAARFEATNAQGNMAVIEGSPDLGGEGKGIRPMELLLMSLAGCSSLDVIHILEKKQGEKLASLDVRVRGTRAGAIPAVYTKIHVTFEATGKVDRHKLERAVELSMKKYCSVTRMIEGAAAITFSVTLDGV